MTDPAQAEWERIWTNAKRDGYASELYAALETERRRLDAEDDGRAFAAPLTRQDCLHGLYFEGVLGRAVEAAKEAAEQYREAPA